VLHNLALLKNVPLPPEAACTGHEPDRLAHAHPHPHPGGVQQRLDVMRNLHTQQGIETTYLLAISFKQVHISPNT